MQETRPLSHRDRSQSREIILLRMMRFDRETRAFAERFRAESDRQVVCLVDERHGRLNVEPFEKVSLTTGACTGLGLFCPPDFGWRCGDYGLYLARQQYPSATNFWLIEADVRISGPDLGEFFRIFDHRDELDLICAHYRESEGWYWDHTIAARGDTVHRCLFDVLRVSGLAVDRLLARRQLLSRNRVRRASWPNDESFLATTLSNDGSVCRDLNDFGRELYTDDTLTFYNVFHGASFRPPQTQITIYHPVLFGEAYEQKVAKLKRIAAGEGMRNRLRRRVIHYLNSRVGRESAATS